MMTAMNGLTAAEQMHVKNEHAKHGFAADWMECATPRCREARLAFGLDLVRCPTCGGSLTGRQWIHAGAEPKILQTVLDAMLPAFVEQIRQAVLAELAVTGGTSR